MENLCQMSNCHLGCSMVKYPILNKVFGSFNRVISVVSCSEKFGGPQSSVSFKD